MNQKPDASAKQNTAANCNGEDESNITDIEVMPDGRIFVFGTSLEVLGVLDQLQMRSDQHIAARIETCRQVSSVPSTDNETQP